MSNPILNEVHFLTYEKLNARMNEEGKNLVAYPIPLPGDALAGIALPGDLRENEVKRILEYIDCLPGVPTEAERGLEYLPIYNRLSATMEMFLSGVQVTESDNEEENCLVPPKQIVITLRIGRYAYIRLAENLDEKDIEQLKNRAREILQKIEPLPNDQEEFPEVDSSQDSTEEFPTMLITKKGMDYINRLLG